FSISDENIRIRIYMHRVYSNENCEEYWSKFTKIPKSRFLRTIYKPTPHVIKKNIDYKGCCRVDIQGSELFWKFQKWQKMLINSYI
ncbi:MAG: hypothetical protein M1338_04120, partial [Patescibacteria group bacterium]|nr:hypothetical protein [Patescibacteria group bacterium]